MQKTLTQRLQNQHQNQRYRQRRELSPAEKAHISYAGKILLSFSSNDYLGLATHPALITALQTAATHYGVGSGSSALIAGFTSAHQDLEKAFAEFLGRDRALYFGNGYMANLGVITALMQQRSDIIYQDKLNHASLIDAAILSKAKLIRYPHQQVDHLEKLLKEAPAGKRLIASESVFSMDGSLTNVIRLAQLAKEHEALLMIDDAHGIGVTGKEGKGVAENLSQIECPLMICPLGKSFGCYGAIVAGSDLVIENILQFARSYTYTTAPPPALAAAALAALNLVRTEEWRREKLNNLIFYFRKKVQTLGISVLDSTTAIQSIMVGEASLAQRISQQLLEQGLFIRDIRPPTVPEGSARLRITLTVHHTEANIDRLLTSLMSAYETA